MSKGRQVRFYALWNDRETLDAAIRSLEPDVVLADADLRNGKVVRLPSLNDVTAQGEIFLARHSARLTFGPLQGEPAFIRSMMSPVVEFTLPVFGETTLREGRLYYNSSYYASDGTLTMMPKDFLVFADRVIATTRRLFKRHHDLDAYVGSSAEEWMRTVGARLVAIKTLAAEGVRSNER
ncbi:MAG TPA: hypothetical protein VGD01_13980 [Candidatus Elarobacter sp.]|jgi:hypothetical protein